ncbi:MAG: septum formation inhibitor Maf [Clostridia bacterium]|nr:septum formation inhibitor Maf [Clostridia bacterium]
MNLARPLILASGSPRRKEILDTMGLSYIVDVSDVDESFLADPESMVLELSRRKAQAVAAKHEDAIVLAADTLVFCREVLGKPRDAAHAREMLRALSGNWHSVFTGVTLIDTASGETLSKADMTRVHFIELSDEEIDAYVASREPLDKAGAYGIQGMSGMFIDRIEGSYSNVVGLPMALVRSMLKEIAG